MSNSKKASKRRATRRAVRHINGNPLTAAVRDSMRAGRRLYGQGLGK